MNMDETSSPPERSQSTGARLVVFSDGLRASWTPAGGFAGAPEIVDAAQAAVRLGLLVQFYDLPPVVASSSSWIGACAALFDFSPRRTLIIEAPAEVEAWIDANRRVCGGVLYAPESEDADLVGAQIRPIELEGE